MDDEKTNRVCEGCGGGVDGAKNVCVNCGMSASEISNLTEEHVDEGDMAGDDEDDDKGMNDKE